ncbi:MAG: DNA replication and repair protein RecF [Actinomycetota bacterium]|nr:DNA replication and repair protein RecF [Actinomycetota bacterium]
MPAQNSLYVEQLALQDFRNYHNEEAQFAPGVNFIVGRNAQGKTNLLEAIHCLGGLGSPRSQDAALIRDGAARAVLHGRLKRGSRRVQIDIEWRTGKGPRCLLNGSPLQGTRALGEVMVCVFFGPDDLLVIKGSPEGRRRLLDDLGVKLRPARHATGREWERVLRQRNALLKGMRATHPGSKERGTALATLEVWDETFCRTGAALAAARLEALSLLLPYAAKRYETIAGGGGFEMSYASDWLGGNGMEGPRSESDLRTELTAALSSVRRREIERGMSLVGPQRDDLMVRLTTRDGEGALDARVYASQGDQRTSALALKLGEHDLLTEVLGVAPVLLLDDVFSELDASRRKWLDETVRDMGQTILSSAEPGGAGDLEPDCVLKISGGRVQRG